MSPGTKGIDILNRRFGARIARLDDGGQTKILVQQTSRDDLGSGSKNPYTIDRHPGTINQIERFVDWGNDEDLARMIRAALNGELDGLH